MKRSELRAIIDEVITEFKDNGDWFTALSAPKQKEYVKDHPDSKYAKDAGKNGDKRGDKRGSKGEKEPGTKLYHFINKILKFYAITIIFKITQYLF